MVNALWLGDSISTPIMGYNEATLYSSLVCQARGWTRVNQALYNPTDVAAYAPTNAAYPGSSLIRNYAPCTVPVAIESFWPRVGMFAVDKLFIYLATNDFGQSSPFWDLKEWDAGWQTLHRQIARMTPVPQVYVIGLQYIFFDTYYDPIMSTSAAVPIPKPYAAWAENRDDAVNKMNSVSWWNAFWHGATYIEIASGMDMTMYDQNPTTGKWSIHPNTKGHQHIAERILAVV